MLARLALQRQATGDLTFMCLDKGFSVVPFWVGCYDPQEEVGRNQKGTTLEPLVPYLAR